MQYRFVSVLVAGALVAVGNGAPISQPSVPDVPPQLVGKPSTVVTWGKRDVVWEGNKDTIEFGKPTTDVSWGKRDTVKGEKDTIEFGKPTTDVSWGKRDEKPVDTIHPLPKPSTEIIWSKRDSEVGASKDTFTLGKPTTVVTWDKRDLPAADKITLGDASTEVSWS